MSLGVCGVVVTGEVGFPPGWLLGDLVVPIRCLQRFKREWVPIAVKGSFGVVVAVRISGVASVWSWRFATKIRRLRVRPFWKEAPINIVMSTRQTPMNETVAGVRIR
ncbi:MAG: hypothetical protein ACI9CV_001224 [Ilumatobacter sp.]|jgi:hypothetical protein